MIPGALLAQPIDPKVQARIDRILKGTPLIDGHNDLPEQLRENYAMSVEGLASGTDQRKVPLMTDMARLHQGGVGGAVLVGLHSLGNHRRRSDPSDARGDRHGQAAGESLSERPGAREAPPTMSSESTRPAKSPR